jgi:catechol 2,3-dioxygenase-like lactoylglutathione lyase family enzyme
VSYARQREARVVGVHHVQLAMPPGGEEAARGFYAGVLGIPEVPKPADLAKRGGVWFESGDVRVHLGIEADHRPARKAHPGFLVASLEQLVGRLRKAGYQITDGEQLDGYAHAYVDDPFGNRLELLERR